MAVNIPSLDLFRCFAPLGKRCSASSAPSEALPVISPTVSRGRRSAGKCSCKLRSILKFDAPSRATFACSGEKFVDHIATSGNQQEVQRRELLKFGAPSRTMVRCSAKKFADGIATSGNQQEACLQRSSLLYDQYVISCMLIDTIFSPYVKNLKRNWKSERIINIITIYSATLQSFAAAFHAYKLSVQEQDFTNTPVIPVYVMLPWMEIEMKVTDEKILFRGIERLGTINTECELVDPDNLINQLKMLKSINVDGVMVDCWWGIVEARGPRQYNWGGYKKLFQIVRELKFKLQVVMSFHECGGNVGDDVHIPLPQWVLEIGSENPDIFFTDKEGRRNQECLSWGIDNERVLRDRTALEVYFENMESFHAEFEEFFMDGLIIEIEIGLGPYGELRYPSYPAKHGWKYSGIGEFQFYDKYLSKSLEDAAKKGTPNILVENLRAQVPGIHWWYNSRSHAAELTAGFYHKT
ncbi:Beta-amylase 7 [Sesamum angolense]|uniref:Beta-amylase n=1 Tax=Sesamum angolense TaxID=2727404 RepID=A0AAE1WU81_9LAMI|nr:Beta-amylase 7 [Sesamum angolense]